MFMKQQATFYNLFGNEEVGPTVSGLCPTHLAPSTYQIPPHNATCRDTSCYQHFPFCSPVPLLSSHTQLSHPQPSSDTSNSTLPSPPIEPHVNHTPESLMSNHTRNNKREISEITEEKTTKRRHSPPPPTEPRAECCEVLPHARASPAWQ